MYANLPEIYRQPVEWQQPQRRGRLVQEKWCRSGSFGLKMKYLKKLADYHALLDYFGI
jgi:hypothetical protein